ncbi:M16 family metallopeptidase, partial [Klebsiella pneumoniae subsp. pneumoniae]
MTIDDLRHWYESWYAPNNATLVVVGDVTADEVKTLAKRYFGEIPWRQLPPARKPLELAEPGERRLKLYVRTQLPNLIMGFNVPSLGSSENPREVNA